MWCTAYRVGIVAIAACVLSCDEPRARVATQDCPSWVDDISTALETRCAECHGAGQPAAGFDVRAYRFVVAGDNASTLLAALDPAAASEPHRAHTELHPLLTTWVGECNLRYRRSLLHEAGIMNPADRDFHGQLIASARYDLTECRQCHGEDLTGGASGSSCVSCHPDGPTACSTCHGDAPTSGAHGRHLVAGPLGIAAECADCHVVPETFDAPGHILTEGGDLDLPPAEIRLEGLAAADTDPPRRASPASYNASTGRCSDVYCHGGVFSDAPSPAWTATSTLGCSSCHEMPPATHEDDRCERCHQEVIDGDRKLIDVSKHLDTTIQLGPTTGSCVGCHGVGEDLAPPTDLEGQTDRSVVTVGAHVAHLEPSRGWSAPVACDACHLVPERTGSTGHIDTASPAEVTWSGAAVAEGAQPTWDRATATCRNVACHGGGPRFADDMATYVDREPVWTQERSPRLTCGSCHGVPPVNGDHDPNLSMVDCAQCHGDSIDASAQFLMNGARHVDGELQVEVP